MSHHIPSASNRLLGDLDAEAYQRLLSHYKTVDLAVSDVLNSAGTPIEYVYFPFVGIISLILPILGKSSLEIALIGNEGMLGAPLMLGVNSSPLGAVVQSKGFALQIPHLEFIQEITKNAAWKRKLNGYLYVLMCQLVQSSGCHRYHLVEERLARLLLMMRDRAHSNDFYITQDLLAKMLGVRRVGISKAACSLKEQRLISYTRGQLLIHDIHGMETASCSCYQLDKKSYESILGGMDQDEASIEAI